MWRIGDKETLQKALVSEMDTWVLPRCRCGCWVGVYAAFTAFAVLLVVAAFVAFAVLLVLAFAVCSHPLSVDVANRGGGEKPGWVRPPVVGGQSAGELAGGGLLTRNLLSRHGHSRRHLHVLRSPDGPR